MAKRVDHDSTMEVSSSQLVPGEVKRPAPHQPPGVAKNDVSMWIGGVVGADEFAGKKERPSGRGRRVMLLLLVVAALGGAATYYFFFRESAPTPSAAPTPPTAPGAPLPPDDAKVASTVSDAAQTDAGVAATALDATLDGGAGLQVDAISGLPAKPPPAKKKVTKKVTKKPVVKKKPTRR